MYKNLPGVIEIFWIMCRKLMINLGCMNYSIDNTA